MDIKFKKLHIENFMSIGEADIDLSDRAFTLIEGVNNNQNDNAKSNGSGKSSIFESLVWTLTGTTMRGNKDVVNFNGNDGALVKLEFIVDTDKFVITRTKEHSKHKTNLFIEINGVDKSGKGVRDSEKLLSEYLPDLTSSLIGSVIVLGQGLPQKFTNNSPSGRKEVLEKLFKSDFMIQDLKDRISNRKSELNDELRKVQDSKLVALTKLEGIIDTINLNNAKLKELQEQDNLEDESGILHKEILELEELVIKTNDSLDCYTIRSQQCNNECYELKNKRLQVVADIDLEYSEVISTVQEKINENSAQERFAKSELDRIKNIKDVCPTCGQKIQGVEKPDYAPYAESYTHILQRGIELKDRLQEIKGEISTKKASMTASIDEELIIKGNELGAICVEIDKIKSELQILNSKLNGKRKRLDDNLKLQQTKHIQIQQLIDSNKINEELQDKLNLDIKECEEIETEIDSRLGIISKFNTVITRDFRGYLLNDIIVYINSRAKEYCKDVFGTDLIEFVLDGNNLLISYNNKEYEALSGGERQKVDLIIQFAIRDMLCRHTSFSSNIIVLDEIFDNLDSVGCQRILDLITKKLYDISSIFIISHHGNELNIPYDDIIKITKDNNGVTRLDN